MQLFRNVSPLFGVSESGGRMWPERKRPWIFQPNLSLVWFRLHPPSSTEVGIEGVSAGTHFPKEAPKEKSEGNFQILKDLSPVIKTLNERGCSFKEINKMIH
jgi:hypothetical protein